MPYLKLQSLASSDGVCLHNVKLAFISTEGIMNGQKRKSISDLLIILAADWLSLPTTLPAHFRSKRKYHLMAGGKLSTSGALPWAIKELRCRKTILCKGSNSTARQLKLRFQQGNMFKGVNRVISRSSKGWQRFGKSIGQLATNSMYLTLLCSGDFKIIFTIDHKELFLTNSNGTTTRGCLWHTSTITIDWLRLLSSFKLVS